MLSNKHSIVNQSVPILGKQKLINSISDLKDEAVNRSFVIESQSQNSLDSEQVIKMQLKQLKRQNQFLKSKIQQLKVQKPCQPLLSKRKSINCKNILRKLSHELSNNTPINGNSLSFILKEIHSILKSLSLVYKCNLQDNLWEQSQNQVQACFTNQYQTVKKETQHKNKIIKKLEIVAIQNQQSRYFMMLDIFQKFYTFKKDTQNQIRMHLQKSIQKTLQISRNLISKANIRATQKSFLKTSGVFSIAQNMQNMPKKQIKLSNYFQDYQFDIKKNGQSWKKISSQKNQMSYSTIQPHNKSGVYNH